MPKFNVITIDRTLLGKIAAMKEDTSDWVDFSNNVGRVRSSSFPEKSLTFDTWRGYIKSQCDKLTTTFSVENTYTDSVVVETVSLLK